MRKILLALLLVAFSLNASADVLKTIQAGATDQSVTIRIIDATDGTPETGVAYNTSGIDLKYWRHGANSAVDITEATQTVNGAHADGGFVHIGHGVYRLDLPDEAVASGTTAVDVFGTVTGMIVIGGTVQLSPPVNTVELAGTAQTGRDIGASVLLSSGTGTGQVSLTSGRVNADMVAVSGDSTAADNLEAAFDGTAGAVSPLGIARQGTAQSATSTTLVLDSAASFADDVPIGMTLVACGSTQGYCQSRVVTDYTSSSDTATVDAWTVTPSGTITYYLFGTAPVSGGGGLDAAGVRSAIGLASANLDTQLSGIQGDTDNIQTRIPAALVSGRMDSSVGAMASNTLTATAIASDAITAAKIASDVGTEIGTATWGIGTRTLTAGTNIVLAKGTGVTGFNDPAASAIADAVWDEARAGHTTAGTFGYYLDSAISGVSTGGVSVSDIADAVWDEALSGHVAAGSAGERLSRIPNAAAGGNGGLPTVNASNQVAGVSGNVVGTVNGLTATAQDNVRTALGMSSANLDTQLSGLSSAIAVIDGIVDQLLIGVNVAEINGVEIIGDGSGTPFGVAP